MWRRIVENISYVAYKISSISDNKLLVSGYGEISPLGLKPHFLFGYVTRSELSSNRYALSTNENSIDFPLLLTIAASELLKYSRARSFP